jgi:hypothetical protein
MYTREMLMDMFKQNEGYNFQIYTDIACGRGINGVDYYSFIGKNYTDDDKRTKGTTSVIKRFAKDYIVIECSKKGRIWYCDAKREVYVPYANIVMVDFVTDNTHPLYGYDGKHNFNEE